MHQFKGMEFSRMIVADVDDSRVTSAATLRSAPEEERPEALLRKRSLLPVAASRAWDELAVARSGKKSALLERSTE